MIVISIKLYLGRHCFLYLPSVLPKMVIIHEFFKKVLYMFHQPVMSMNRFSVAKLLCHLLFVHLFVRDRKGIFLAIIQDRRLISLMSIQYISFGRFVCQFSYRRHYINRCILIQRFCNSIFIFSFFFKTHRCCMNILNIISMIIANIGPFLTLLICKYGM